MPSYWSFSIRLSKYATVGPSAALLPPVRYSHCHLPPLAARPCPLRLLDRSISTATSLQPKLTGEAFSPDVAPPFPSPQPPRAVAQAVRSALQAHKLDDAYALVKPLCFPGPQERPQQPSNTYRNYRPFASQTDGLLSGPVSPRLPAHCLLHGLIRLGLTKKASILATEMMSGGLRVHPSSLEALMSRLSPAPSSSYLRNHPPKAYSIPCIRAGDLSATVIVPGRAKHKGTRDALRLFMEARQYRQHRTDGMYELLLCACIINGEIILASLLYGLYLRETQLTPKLTGPENVLDRQVVASNASKGHTRSRYFPFRSTQLLHNLLHPINLVLSKPPSSNKEEHAAALQSLANLAMLLQNPQLPISAISPLLRALYSHPPSNAEVILRDAEGELRTVNAYEHFQFSLLRLIRNLLPPTHPKPTSRPVPSHSQSHSIRLNRHSYNALLHYALRHRWNPALAMSILDHMTTQREPPLKPDTTTINILLRAGTLLRRPDIARVALQQLHLPDAPQSTAPRPERCLLVSTSMTNPCCEPVQTDDFTLNAYILHLSSTGRPSLVFDILSKLFPGFSDALRSPYRQSPPQQWLDIGVPLGPHFFTIAITALRNSHAFHAATCLWQIAKNCEHASKSPSTGQKPWNLPVHTYTVMIQVHLCQLKHMRRRANQLSLRPENRISRRSLINRFDKVFKGIEDRTLTLYRELKSKGSFHLPPKDRPDARLFNAMIDAFVSGPQKPFHTCVQELTAARSAFANEGTLPDNWSPVLHEIGQDIVNYGYTLPPGLQLFYVGRWFNHDLMVTNPSAPSRSCSTLRIPTQKTRGLRHWRVTRRRRRLRPSDCGGNG